jgi:hypothetical protein
MECSTYVKWRLVKRVSKHAITRQKKRESQVFAFMDHMGQIYLISNYLKEQTSNYIDFIHKVPMA